MEPKVFHSLGQRDALAGLFALIRLKGEKAALMEVAAEYQKAFGDNPHVKWYTESQSESPSPNVEKQ
jgi:hypothetical protein